jgi:hypothetical protein
VLSISKLRGTAWKIAVFPKDKQEGESGFEWESAVEPRCTMHGLFMKEEGYDLKLKTKWLSQRRKVAKDIELRQFMQSIFCRGMVIDDSSRLRVFARNILLVFTLWVMMNSLFSETSLSQAMAGLFHGEGLMVLMMIVAMLVAGIAGIAKLYMVHRERMAMIERRIHPDYKEKEPQTGEESPESANRAKRNWKSAFLGAD